MKRYFTILLLFAATLQMFAQTPASSRRPLWVGLDMGGTWQASDMKGLGGIGWSFTLSRYSKLDKTGPLYFGWRFRFLDGRNYGYNYHRLYGLQADPVLSSGATNYATPTATNDGYVYSNYRMRFDEFAYELIIGSNGLRKHGVLLYGFGGIGLTHWKTTTNQLDENLQQYDYSQINLATNGNDDALHQNLKDMWRFGDYETIANGSKSSGQWNFMPSAGIGFGYQWSNAVAIGVEHRTTWALNDYIDGVNHDYTGAKTPNNDLYNYDGLFVRWTFGGNGNSRSNVTSNNPTPPNPNTYTPNPNPVVTTPPNNNPNPTYTPPNNNPNPNPVNTPTGYPPQVRFTTPSVEPYTATVVNQQLVVRVDNVSSSSNITLLINNQVSHNFTFNPSTNTMVFNHMLQNGVNTYQVTGSNQYGSASDVQTIYYNTQQTPANTTPLPPAVTITNPSVDPYTSATPTMNVTATVLNVTTVTGVQVRRNGSPVTNFTFDPNTHQVTFLANLATGSNLYEVIGTNSVGSASDHTTINYNPVAAVQPPVVTITSPASCPYSVKSNAFTITAKVTNVTAANQVSVIFNGQPFAAFNFVNMGAYAQVSFPVTLNPGVNPFSITGTNTAGTDTKSCQITYKVTTAPTPEQPPVVNITNPSLNPYASIVTPYGVTATVLNVTMANQIVVTGPASHILPFNFNAATHTVTFSAALIVGANLFTVTATNSAGSASDNTTITYALASPTTTGGHTNPSDPNTNASPVGGPGNNGNTPDPNGGSSSQTGGDPNTNQSPVGGPGNTNTQDPNAVAGPAIILVNPSSTTANATTQAYPVTMTVTGVNSITEIIVRVNNVVLTTASYNGMTHMLSFTASLNSGSNSIQVMAQNSNGSASQTLTVTFAQTGRTGGGNSSTNTNRGGSSSTSGSSKPRGSSSTTSGSTTSSSGPATQPKKPATTSTETKAETKPETTSTSNPRTVTPASSSTAPKSTTPAKPR